MSMDVMGTMGAAGGSSAVAAAKNSFGDLSSEEFIKILVTELTTQDPMEPNDSAQVLEQLSSLRNIEGQMNLQDQLKNLVLQNQVSQASGLIGKVVRGLDAENNRVEGTVTSVRVTDDKAVLELDTGRTLEMKRVEQIAERPASTSSDAFGQLV